MFLYDLADALQTDQSACTVGSICSAVNLSTIALRWQIIAIDDRRTIQRASKIRYEQYYKPMDNEYKPM